MHDCYLYWNSSEVIALQAYIKNVLFYTSVLWKVPHLEIIGCNNRNVLDLNSSLSKSLYMKSHDIYLSCGALENQKHSEGIS